MATTVTNTQKKPKGTTISNVSSTQKKRGRQGTRINEAFNAITNKPVGVEQFCKDYNVSINVLRQSKRFDKDARGQPRTDRNIKIRVVNGVQSIWAEKTE